MAGVYRVSADLKTINCVVRDFANPNGLAFSPDEKVLYVNDSNRHVKHIRAFDVEANGMLDLGSERLFCDLKGDDRPGAPDGMKVDVEGNVYCTGPGGIWVIDPEGQHIGTVLTRAVNMAWGGDDWTTLFFTGPTTINRIHLAIPGIPVPRGSVEA
jgi:gluconolactonase